MAAACPGAMKMLIKVKSLAKIMYSDVFVASDGAPHSQRSNLNSSRVVADTTLDGSVQVSGCP